MQSISTKSKDKKVYKGKFCIIHVFNNSVKVYQRYSDHYLDLKGTDDGK